MDVSRLIKTTTNAPGVQENKAEFYRTIFTTVLFQGVGFAEEI